jgi:dTDP-4-amino-4,6-dideoxygalactose transaminase
MNVPFIDFSEQYKLIKDEVDSGWHSVCSRSAFIQGKEVADFENAFASYCGARFGVGVNSGTDALYLALSALNIGPGDEVILPTHTFIATALCVSYTGARPVFVDIETETYNMDPSLLKRAITPRTKVIMPVHLYGQTAEMDDINAIAGEAGITVVEDAAQAHGATYNGRKAGSLGDVACFSFYPTKSLGGFGDGGMILTDNHDVYEKVRMLRDYGRTDRYAHKIKGHNSRLDTLQAVVLNAKLKYLDEWNQMRAAVADQYRQRLTGTPVTLPAVKKGRGHVYQTFCVAVDHRDEVIEELKARGVSALIHYPIPVHLQEAYSDLGYQKGDFSNSEHCADRILSLPMFPHMTAEQIEYVCESMNDVFQKVAL